MKKTIWVILRIITIAVAIPFLIMKFIGDAADTLLYKVLDWEDDNFGW